MPAVYVEQVAPHLRTGTLLDFASGYNVAFDLIRPAPDLDVVLVAPRMIGVGVRDTYVEGGGFPSFVSVHQDATGRARARMLAIAKAIGSTRAGCIEMSMHDEATLDLFTEQGFGPAFGRVMMSAIELLVGAGYPPEAVLLELYLSGELAYGLGKIRDVGMVRQMDFHSRTSQYGSITRGVRYLGLDPALKEKMGVILDEIRSGRFAQEWTQQQDQAAALFDKVKEAREKLPLTQWEDRARAAFGIGDAVKKGD
jgi:ketol-acid reductoisomerase